MEQRLKFIVTCFLAGCFAWDLVKGQTGCARSLFKKDHTCQGYGYEVEIYRDVKRSGEYRLICCRHGASEIKAHKKLVTSCIMSSCTISNPKDICEYPVRMVGGKKLPYEEILRERCTTPRGQLGHTGLCCQPKSAEGQLTATLGAEPNEFPHMVKLKLPGHCGGTIYSKRFIITAAHCVVDKDTKLVKNATEMKVIIGSNSADAEDKRYVYQVKRAIPHEGYSRLHHNAKTKGDKFLNDVGLLELDRDIEFGPNVKSLEIAHKGFEPLKYSDKAVIVGWGITDTLSLSIHLQKANFALRTNLDCFEKKGRNGKAGRWSHYNEYKDQLLCVGGVLADKWSLTAGGGDSGGPAICRGPDGRALLCGVTSFGGDDELCLQNQNEQYCPPSVYARVSYFSNWIRTKAGKQDSSTFYKPYLYGEPIGSKGKYDHQVHITSKTGKSCGGTLVAPDIVVTAASCVANGNGTTLTGVKVHYGIADLKMGKGTKAFDVAKTSILKGFSGHPADIKSQGNRIIIADGYYEHNLAVLRLNGKAPIQPHLLPHLPKGEPEMLKMGRELAFPRNTALGSKLLLTQFNFLENRECQKRMDRFSRGHPDFKVKVENEIICGVEKFSGGSTCDRELGGGLLCKEGGKEVLCGVQIFRLCESSLPNTFIDLYDHRNFVKSAMGKFH